MLPIIWKQTAEGDLLDIIRYIGRNDPWAAKRLGNSIKTSTWPLSEHPYLYRQSQRIPGCREIIAHPNYIVVYRVGLNCVEVLRVLHARQEYP